MGDLTINGNKIEPSSSPSFFQVERPPLQAGEIAHSPRSSARLEGERNCGSLSNWSRAEYFSQSVNSPPILRNNWSPGASTSWKFVSALLPGFCWNCKPCRDWSGNLPPPEKEVKPFDCDC